jgi:hypothetical protein
MISNFFAKNMIIGMVFFVQNYQIFDLHKTSILFRKKIEKSSAIIFIFKLKIMFWVSDIWLSRIVYIYIF